MVPQKNVGTPRFRNEFDPISRVLNNHFAAEILLLLGNSHSFCIGREIRFCGRCQYMV